MKFVGKFTWRSSLQEGTSKAGNPWKKLEFVVTEDAERFPNQLLCTAFNDKVEQVAHLNIGTKVEVEYDLKVRDWTTQTGAERKSMEANLFRLVSLEQQAQAPAPATQPATPTQQPIDFNQQQSDGLPF